MTTNLPQITPQVPTANQVERAYTEVTATAEMLRTESDRISILARFFGFGRRILVPADEIHVVVGDGIHNTAIARQSKVFGKTAGHSSFYWLNSLTQVIKLKTVSFTVAIRGEDSGGVGALDTSKVSFRLSAHAVAKLNPDKAEIAAQRVGLDTTSLLNTITKVGTAELVAAAAGMALEQIIANRQALAEIAFPKVNQILAELGYDLALLTVTELGGEAYEKLVEQAEARVSKETAIATNKEQIDEIQDRQARERVEAEIKAKTDKKLAAERLDAEREVEEATLGQQEVLAIRRHELDLRQVDRTKAAAAVGHDAKLAKVQLDQTIAQTEAENRAKLARIVAEREAELKVMQQQKDAALILAQTQAKAEQLALEQVRQIERAAEQTQAEARRLEAEELAAAERTKKVIILEASQSAEALKIETDAQAQAELVTAEAEATATEKRAQAAKIRAEATRAESAALGLAEAEVEAARVQIAEQQVAVNRAEGLAKVAVQEAQALADAKRLRELMALYAQAPVLVDLEKIKLEMAHTERLTQMQVDAHLRAFEALAPNMRIHIFGNGGQVSRVMGDVLSLVQGVRTVGEEVPAVGRLFDGNAASAGSDEVDMGSAVALLGGLGMDSLMPAVRQVVKEVNPRMLAGMSVADLTERLGAVVSGQEDLSTALGKLQADGTFRLIGDLPVMPILRGMGVVGGESAEPVSVNGVALAG